MIIFVPGLMYMFQVISMRRVSDDLYLTAAQLYEEVFVALSFIHTVVDIIIFYCTV